MAEMVRRHGGQREVSGIITIDDSGNLKDIVQVHEGNAGSVSGTQAYIDFHTHPDADVSPYWAREHAGEDRRRIVGMIGHADIPSIGDLMATLNYTVMVDGRVGAERIDADNMRHARIARREGESLQQALVRQGVSPSRILRSMNPGPEFLGNVKLSNAAAAIFTPNGFVMYCIPSDYVDQTKRNVMKRAKAIAKETFDRAMSLERGSDAFKEALQAYGQGSLIETFYGGVTSIQKWVGLVRVQLQILMQFLFTLMDKDLIDESMLLRILQTNDFSRAKRILSSASDQVQEKVFVQFTGELSEAGVKWGQVAEDLFPPQRNLHSFCKVLGQLQLVRQVMERIPVDEEDRDAFLYGSVGGILRRLWNNTFQYVGTESLVPTSYMPDKLFTDFQFFPWAKYVSPSALSRSPRIFPLAPQPRVPVDQYVSPVRGLLGGEEDDPFE